MGWTVDAGVAGLHYPRFPGANRSRTRALPSIEIHDGDLFFLTFADGIGLDLIRGERWHAGPVANVAFPRRERDDRSALNGLGDVPLTVETGGYLRYEFDRYATAKAEVRQGIGGRHGGAIVDLSLVAHAPPLFGESLFLSLGPRVDWYDGRYARVYYGVDETQASRSGYARFEPASGAKVGATATAVWLAGHSIALTVFAEPSWLVGPVADSPLVRGRAGSRSQAVVGLALTYRLWP